MIILEVIILEYSISEIAKKMKINVSTLRYYDNIGLFHKLKKDKVGNRIFTEEDIEVLRIIQYLKKSGMQLVEIKEFMNWCKQSDSTLVNRLDLFKKQKEKVLQQINELQKTLSLIEFKEWYYAKLLKKKQKKILKICL